MMLRNSVLLAILIASASVAGACSAPADLDEAAPDQAEGESALVAEPRKCENMQFTMTAEFVTPKSMAVPKPYTARIINNGRQISCNGPSGDVNTTFTWKETFKTPFTHLFNPQNLATGAILVQPPVPAQSTEHAVHPNPMTIISCLSGPVTLKTPGFPDKRMAIATSMDPPVIGRDSRGNNTITLTCHLRVKGPVSTTRDRPANLVRASGDTFTYACDLNTSDRRNACTSLCSQQCTANVTPPIDAAGVNSCISQCADRCTNVTCTPTFCTDDCPTSECAPENVCTSASQCGSGRTCGGNGCCIPIIR